MKHFYKTNGVKRIMNTIWIHTKFMLVTWFLFSLDFTYFFFGLFYPTCTYMWYLFIIYFALINLGKCHELMTCDYGIPDNVCTHECNSMRLCRFYEFPTSKTGLIHSCFLCSSFSLSLTQLLCPTCFPFHILSPSDMICSMNVIDSKVLLWASLHICWYKSGSNLEIFVFNHCLQ